MDQAPGIFFLHNNHKFYGRLVTCNLITYTLADSKDNLNSPKTFVKNKIGMFHSAVCSYSFALVNEHEQ